MVLFLSFILSGEGLGASGGIARLLAFGSDRVAPNYVDRNPYLAGLASAGLFFIGALPCVIPFAVFDDTQAGLLAAALLAGIGLLAVGATKTVMTKTNPAFSAFENLGLGFAGGLLSYLVGQAFDALIS